ncbi:MAG: exodeoxyribonuclease VII large subunit [Candidatus Kryptoniota bacterium]
MFEGELENSAIQSTATLNQKVLKVKELNRQVRELLEQGFSSVVVEGEISNFKRHQPSGHLYFTLKDDEAQIRVVMWRSDAIKIRFELSDGMKIYAKGRVSLYEQRGDYQLYAVSIYPAGEGALQIAFEQLKRKLEAEGLFAEEHKKPIPEFPKRIGVVTSLEGAAVRDIINIISRRYPIAEIIVYPVKVQGDGAAEEIAEAIRNFNIMDNVDVLIIGRGGGSLEDLWAFNEEIVARAIYDSKIPTISAVGHQVDFTIADFVADIRAATPSAAAEIVVPDKNEILSALAELPKRLNRFANQVISSYGMSLEKLIHHYAFRQPIVIVEQKSQTVDEFVRRLQTRMEHYVETTTQRVNSAESHLIALSPDSILNRGYAIIEGSNGIIDSATSLIIGDSARIHMHDGSVDSTITGKNEEERDRKGSTVLRRLIKEA